MVISRISRSVLLCVRRSELIFRHPTHAPAHISRTILQETSPYAGDDPEKHVPPSAPLLRCLAVKNVNPPGDDYRGAEER